MSLQYDFYANFHIKTKKDVEDLTRSSGKYAEISDVLLRIMLLNGIFSLPDEKIFSDYKGRANKLKPIDYARVGEDVNHLSGLKALIHSNGNFNEYITGKLSELHLLDINSSIDISALPKGSWAIEFPITLAKPFISKDDVPLYIIENPVRKDKVFGVPFTSAMAWKGNLRWAMMKAYFEPKVNDPNKFTEIRFQHTLLFGTEKGMEEKSTGWAKYIDELCKDAEKRYQEKLKSEFRDEKPNIAGMLHFYPTFWNRIDMEVINPHDRTTKTGKNPIYFEVVPAGAKGFFRLLYVPFYYFRKSLSDDKLERKILQDLLDLVAGLKEMMLTYGFSAKKSTGYGIIEEKWDKEASKLMIRDFIGTEKFGDFEELQQKVRKLMEENDE